MTTKEKANAYDRALEKVIPLYEQAKKDDCPIWSTYEHIFPVLKESEDEMIRKEMIAFLKSEKAFQTIDLPKSERWITYLERQKEQNGEEDKDFTIYHPLKNEVKGEYECFPYSFYGSLTSFSENKDLIDFLHTCFYTEEECNQWIEQQKEQKQKCSINFDPRLNEFEACMLRYLQSAAKLKDDNMVIIHTKGYAAQLMEIAKKDQKPLTTEETELNSLAFLEQIGYTCIPPEKEQKPKRERKKPKGSWLSKSKYELAHEEELLIKRQKELSEIRALKNKERKPAEWKPQPESLEALMYAIEGKWDMIPPTSYLSRKLEDLYEGLVNTFNVDESFLTELPKVTSRAYTIEELRELKHKIEASMEHKPVECGCTTDESDYDMGYREGKKFQLRQVEQYTIGKTFMGLIPCWVNAPSELQPAHKYHGKNAVIMHENNGGFQCCFIDDEKATIVHLPEDTLFVEGWRKKSAEWSEEDTKRVKQLIYDTEHIRAEYEKREKELGESFNDKLIKDCDEQIAWLKSLRPQLHWKPSEEQMNALRSAVNKLAKTDVADSVRLSIMYDNFKKLM